MKLKSITITGMHKVDRKTYDFNDSVTYFVGPNGAGKSTVLEAVQLALLGYVPGYSKTNDSIMMHASDSIMSVDAKFDNDVAIVRTWIRSKSAVKSTVDVTGYDGEVSELLGDVALAIFDFNEFKSMTANKLKDWFISFLPSSTDSLDISKELAESLGTRPIPYDDLIEEALQYVTNLKSNNPDISSVDIVRNLNTKFKEDQSFVKGQIANLEGTLKSLIKYDDTEVIDSSEITNQINELQEIKTKLIQYQSANDNYIRAKTNFDSIKQTVSAENFASDPRANAIKAQIDEITKRNEIMVSDYNDIMQKIWELKNERSKIHVSSTVTCPYTNESCETAKQFQDKIKQKAYELDEKIKFKQSELDDCSKSKIDANARELLRLNSELGAIDAQYNRLAAMQMQLDSFEPIECPTDKTLLQIDSEIRDLNGQLIKIEANKRYDELSDKVTSEKFKLENNLAIYKVWAKLTDANGLQTSLMNKPFEDLEKELSIYLSNLFNCEIKAKFNLSSKANSFSFGIERNGNYIAFDCLSSGERCLFALSLMMCILNKSSSNIRTIVIDDALDHLDSENASYLFEALKKVENIQFILAGVKECSDEAICRRIS